MSLKAGFSEIVITPPLGMPKQGWKKRIIADHVRDPLYARCAAFELGGERIGFIQLDTLSVPAGEVRAIRVRIAAAHDWPGERIMISATHNHAGPAMSGSMDYERDEEYIGTLVARARHGLRRGGGEARALGVGHGERVRVGPGPQQAHPHARRHHPHPRAL